MDKFLKFVSEIFDADVKELSLETEYNTIPQWTSLMHLRLVAEIEEEYGVEIPIDIVPDLKSLEDFYEYIKE